MQLKRCPNIQLSTIILLLTLLSCLSAKQVNGAKILRSDIAEQDSGGRNQNDVLGRQEDYDSEDGDGGRVPWVTPRIKDITSGIDGILQGIFARNPDKLLQGSFEFIPSPVRVGVKGILSTIAGRPVAETPTTTKKPDYTISKRGIQTTPAPENDSEEEILNKKPEYITNSKRGSGTTAAPENDSEEDILEEHDE